VRIFARGGRSRFGVCLVPALAARIPSPEAGGLHIYVYIVYQYDYRSIISIRLSQLEFLRQRQVDYSFMSILYINMTIDILYL
jgi:hypothetical protein